MEILSDAVFHGDVSIGSSTNQKSLKLYGLDSCGLALSTLTIGQTGGTEILKTDGIAKFGMVNADNGITTNSVVANHFDLSCSTGSAYMEMTCSGVLDFFQFKNANHFYFGEREIGKKYYIATQDQIPSMDGVAHVQSLPITFDVPADCTRFYMPGVNSITPYSIQLFKHNETTGESGDFVKNVDLGIVCGSKVNAGSGPRGAVVVEKSSSFAMCSTDGYSIRIVY